MDEQGFRLFLKRMGKLPHVIDELVQQVAQLRTWLAHTGGCSLAEITSEDLLAYTASLDTRQVKSALRGAALYFKFSGQADLAHQAASLREQQIATTRRAFPLREFFRADLATLQSLESIGIRTAEALLSAGSSSEQRRALVERLGCSPLALLELVKMADLARLFGIKGIRARLYYEAGLDSPHKFLAWQAEPLRQYLSEFVETSGFPGIPPLLKELEFTIKTAQTLPVMVEDE